MKKKIAWILMMVLVSANSGKVFSQDRIIQTVVPFLTIAPDSRAGAMGDVGAATSPDVYSMHYNPAKYSFIDGKGGMGISYSPWLRSLVPDMNVAYISGYYRVDTKQTLAATLTYNAFGEVIFTDLAGEIQSTFHPNELAVDGSYSRLFSENFSGSIALRFIYSNLTAGQVVGNTETKPGTSYAADLSGYYRKDIKIAGKEGEMAIGFNMSNIGSKMTYTDAGNPDFIPMNMKIGTCETVYLDNYNTISLALDFNKLLVPTPPKYDPVTKEIISGKDPDVSVPVAIFQSFFDAPGGFKEELQEITYSIGLEYWYDKQFALRGGYFNENEFKGNRKYFTAGAGFRLNVFAIDFSYLMPLTQNNPLARTIRFSLSFDFAALKNASRGRG